MLTTRDYVMVTCGVLVVIVIVFAINAAYGSAPRADWQPYFAWRPVYVDAYDNSEIKDGKMRYLKWGWVERKWESWVDSDFGDKHEYWKYRNYRKRHE
jgi:hypothetical protein